MLKSMNFLRGKNRGIFKTSPRAGEVGALLRVRGNKNITTGTKAESPAPVILGRDAQSVPRILWQRVSNLVNKFALLLHKCWFSAFCTFFKYPSPDAEASPSPAGGEGLHRSWCDKILGTDCASRPSMTGGRGVNPLGRSMIEMLGVLAIIAVLSVGGIAGYSKAMQKWKVNKISEEYSFVLQGLIEHLDTLKYLNSTSDTLGLVDVLQASAITPTSWKKIDNLRVYDSNGNPIAIFSRDNVLGFSVNIGGYRKNDDGKTVAEGFSKQTCLALFNNVFYPLHAAVRNVYIYVAPDVEEFWGDSYCSDGLLCLRDVTLAGMNKACSACDGQTFCDISLTF